MVARKTNNGYQVEYSSLLWALSSFYVRFSKKWVCKWFLTTIPVGIRNGKGYMATIIIHIAKMSSNGYENGY